MGEAPNERVDVAIVGAGAAGLATAIFALRQAPQLKLVLLESARRPGAKILVSGGGRCNVTNSDVGAADFWQPSSATVKRVLRAFTVEDTRRFFAELGVTLHEEPGGKLFPDSNKSRTVLDALLGEAQRARADLRCGQRVSSVTRQGGAFELITNDGPLAARRVVLATGGRSLPKSGSDGHGYEMARRLGLGFVATTPALAPLVLEGTFHVALSGVTLPVEIALSVLGEKPLRVAGSLLFTHFGLSGPAALDVSRAWHRVRLSGRVPTVSVSFRPGHGFESTERELVERARAHPRQSLGGVLGDDLPQSLAEGLLAALRLDPQQALGRLERADRRRLAHALVAWPVVIRDSRGYDYAEATAGGVPLDDVSAGALEARVCPGLHLAGEILDVDGRLGGFNFQWAWSSGFVVGRALARAHDTDSARRQSE
jgi:predicted Rossmann fold flavoprotein